MVMFSLQIHVFIGGVADPGVAIAILAFVAIRQDGQSLKLVEFFLFFAVKSSSNFLTDDCMDVCVFIGQCLTRLGLVTVEMHLLALTGFFLPFMAHASFAPVDGDFALLHGVVAIPMVLAIVTSLAIGTTS
eukprot:2648201-Ditylum_brightwellii.AAC.1